MGFELHDPSNHQPYQVGVSKQRRSRTSTKHDQWLPWGWAWENPFDSLIDGQHVCFAVICYHDI